MYSAVFNVDPDDSTVEVSAFGVPLKIKPLRLRSGDAEVSADASDLRFAGKDKVEYVRLFAGKGKIEYQLDDKKLKESIIFEDSTDFPSRDSSTSTSTNSGEVVYIRLDASDWDLASSTRSTDETVFYREDIGSPASSTVSVEFSLAYPKETELSLDGRTPWDRNGVETADDIYLIRKKTPNRRYPTNRFYRIYRPYVSDAAGKKRDLTYRLLEDVNQTRLVVDLPPEWLKDAEYPIVVDPTIGMDGIDGWYRFTNTRNCSTAAADCSSITDTPSGSDVLFKVLDGCASSGDAYKDIFEFNLEDLEADYSEPLFYADMYFHGDCDNIAGLPNSYYLAITQIDPYVDPTPNCSDDPFSDYRSDVYELYGEGTGYSCLEGDRSVYVTSIMQDALDAVESHLAFKLDLQPTNRWDDDPAGGNAGYYISRYSDDLYIEYYFTCLDSGDCPTSEFCLDQSTDMCWPDYADGENCENKATDDDDYACINNVCEYDGFDSSGYFCSDGVKCVNDYELYDNGTWHCENQDWAKLCGTNGDWGGQVDCDWGCNETMGCATTTTTTTTLPTPNIQATPDQVIITVIR